MDDVNGPITNLPDHFDRIARKEVAVANHPAHQDRTGCEECRETLVLDILGDHLLQIGVGGLQEQRGHPRLRGESEQARGAAERLPEDADPFGA